MFNFSNSPLSNRNKSNNISHADHDFSLKFHQSDNNLRYFDFKLSIFVFLKYLIAFYTCACERVYTNAHMSTLPYTHACMGTLLLCRHREVRGQVERANAFLPPCGSQELKSVHQAWWQSPLRAISKMVISLTHLSTF